MWGEDLACVYEDIQVRASECHVSLAKHMTKILYYQDMDLIWLMEKVTDGTCIIEKVDSKENNSNMGTKCVPKFTFDYLTHNLVDKSLRTNIQFIKYT